ncbi:MAG: prephenate dehydratase [Puniceicoccaceae bacterium]
MTLEKLRDAIDEVDAELVALLNRRVELAAEIGHLKGKTGGPIFVPAREREVFDRVAALSKGPLDGDRLRPIFREIISASISMEGGLKIAYLGPEATFTHQASLVAFGSQMQHMPLTTIPEVFSAVERRQADHGVIPIENSTEGAVFHSLDMLVESPLKIISQVYLRIEHCLLGEGDLESVKRVYSKDQAIGQCREWLATHLKRAELISVHSTAGAVRNAMEEEGSAAIASSVAATTYGVPVLARGIEDHPDNTTRFFVLGREASRPSRTGKDKTSLVFSLRDEVGALKGALEAFGERRINLTKIESRPSRRRRWDYYFFADCEGHMEDAQLKEVFDALEKTCPFVKWLGSYPDTGNTGQ